MQAIMETLFDICYLSGVLFLGVAILRRAALPQQRLFGWMAIVLGCGDAFLSGLLLGLTQEKPIEHCLHPALAAAAIVLQEPAALSEKLCQLKPRTTSEPQ